MTTLHDRLAGLADAAPASMPEPGLWERGLRYRRVRRNGTLGIVATALTVLALLGGATWQRSVPAPAPAPASGPVGLPDRVWNPSPWLPSSDRPGQLVAVTRAERGSWTGSRPGVVGISASTGEYAFLDLPDAELGGTAGATLSPDGLHLAYWFTGHTADTPNTSAGPVTGVAVLDTETGAVRRDWIRTAHGLSPDSLVWADTDTVVFSAGQILGGDDDSDVDRSSSRPGAVMSWSPDGEPAPVPGVPAGAWIEGAAHGRILVDTGSERPGRAHRLIGLADPSGAGFAAFPSIGAHLNQLMPVALDPTGRRIALVPGNRNPSRVHAGPIGHVREVPNTQGTWGVLDWLDSDTIVTLRRARDLAEEGSALYRVSVSTGESRTLVRFPALGYGGGWQFATDLLGAPSVHAEKPPSPLDPRLVAGLALGTALAAGAALVLWRRRVRP